MDLPRIRGVGRKVISCALSVITNGRWTRCGGPTPRCPPARPVRLAKRTSNLFRPRSAPRTAGPRRERPDRGARGRRGRADRRRAGHVHVRGPGRRDAAARADAAGRAAVAHDHAGRRGDRARASSRRRSATGCRTSRCSRWTSSPARARSSRPDPTASTPTCSPAFPNSLGSLGYATRLRIELQPVGRYVALRNVRFTRLEELIDAIGEVIATGAWAGEPVDAMDGVMFSPGESYLVLGTFTDERRRPSERLHRPGDLLPLAAPAHPRRADRVRLSLALGHRLVLVLGGVRGAAPGRPAALAGALPAQRRLPPARAAGAPAPGGRPDRPAAGPAGPRAGRAGRGDPAGPDAPSSCAGSRPAWG